MLQALIDKAKQWRLRRKTLMIITDIKSGKILVSYKGQTATGGFTDKTLHNMMKGVHFEKSVRNYLMAIAKLINQVTQK